MKNSNRPIRRRARKPLAVAVVPATETIDFTAWARQYAAVVVRLYRQDHAQQAAA